MSTKLAQRLKWLGFTLVLGGVLMGVAWSYRAPLLTGLATTWEINDPLAKADAIVILGGGSATRPFEAARLYQQGWAPRILIAQVESSSLNQIGIQPRESEVSRAVLDKLGIPAAAIVSLGSDVTSTRDEALALRDWLQTHKLHTVIIPTDFTHTRRVDWLMRRTLPAETQALVVSLTNKQYNQTNWWQKEPGLMAFQNEVIKLLLYWWRY